MMPKPQAIRLHERAVAGSAGGRVIDARYTVIEGDRPTWRTKAKTVLVTLACAALAGMALPPLVMGAYILQQALTR